MARRRQRRRGFLPPYFWPYVIGWAIVSLVYLVFVLIRAVVMQLPGNYFTAMLYLYLTVGGIISLIESAVARSRESEQSEATSRMAWLALILFVGYVPAGLLLFLVLSLARVDRDTPAGDRAGTTGNGAAPAPAGRPAEPRPPRVVKEPPPAANFAGLAGYWTFDEGQGARAQDASGHGQHGTVHGCRWVSGVRGKALQFQTKEDYFDYGGSPQLNFPAQSSFSFAGWIQTTATRGTIVSQRNRADGGPVIDIGLTLGRLQAMVREDGGEAGQPATAKGPRVNDGEWHHFVLVRQAGGVIELYVDGQPAGRGSGRQGGGAITTNLRSVAREQYWLSGRPGPGNPSWSGCIDEFAVFNRALTAEEIKSLAGQGP